MQETATAQTYGKADIAENVVEYVKGGSKAKGEICRFYVAGYT